MDPDDFFGLQVLFHREREPRIDRLRADPRESMSDPEFIRHYRFRYRQLSVLVIYRLYFYFHLVRRPQRKLLICWSQTY